MRFWRSILQLRALRRVVLETDRVTDLLSELHVHFVRNTLRHIQRGNTTRLRAAHNLVGSGMRRQVMEHQRLQNHTLS